MFDIDLSTPMISQKVKKRKKKIIMGESLKYYKKKVFRHLNSRFKSELVEKTDTRICISQILWIY